ncbi:acyltransferase [Ochrobactrum intermedium]|uniref:acyltransferase family protein n=1 Tax=Brucella intermedia TaxID=94625 RepID=UPI00128D3969|nr:acyltransferase [Brucella intermedia]MPR61301.1 acyltransferase [Brucella intermedia]
MIRFHHLDTLRFFLALYVALGHSIGWVSFFKSGGLAVDFFFILSGFVISQSIIRKNMPWTHFFVRRFARMWPINLITILPILVIYGVPSAENVLFSNIALLQNSGVLKELTLNIPSWSISAEFIVGIFALWPMVRYRNVPIATFVVLLGFILLLESRGPLDHMTFERIGLTTAGVVRSLIGCSLGYLIYEAHLYFKDRCQNVRLIWIPHLVSVIGVFVLLGLEMRNDGKSFAILFSALTIFLLSLSVSNVTTVLSHRSLSWLGNMSFGFYMWHFPVLIVFIYFGLLDWAPHNLSMIESGDVYILLRLSAYLLTVLAMSYVSFHLIERPAQKFILKALENGRLDSLG